MKPYYSKASVLLEKLFHVSKQNRIWERIKLPPKSHLTMYPDSTDRPERHKLQRD